LSKIISRWRAGHKQTRKEKNKHLIKKSKLKVSLFTVLMTTRSHVFVEEAWHMKKTRFPSCSAPSLLFTLHDWSK